MKLMSSACLFSVIISVSVAHASPSFYSRCISELKKTTHSYQTSMATALSHASIPHPFAVLNIGSHDPEQVAHNKEWYKKRMRALRAAMRSAKYAAAQTSSFLKTKTGKHILYETGLFVVLAAGGYTLWKQNERTQAYLADMRSNAADVALAQQQRDAALMAEITALQQKIDRLAQRMANSFDQVDQTIADELDAAKRAMHILAAEVRAPNRAEAAMTAVRDAAVSGGARLAGSLWHRIKNKKAAFDAQLEAREAAFDAALAADAAEDDGGAGAGIDVGAQKIRFYIDPITGKPMFYLSQA